MIANLKGKIIGKSSYGLIVENNDIGYEVFVTDQVLLDSKEGETIELKISENIREDSYSLFGFTEQNQKDFYSQLVAISGVGPKMAMAILSTDSVSNLQKAVLAGKTDAFKSVLGVGAKTAQRIILELKGKIDLQKVDANFSQDPVYQALISLGYHSSQANQAMQDLPENIKTDEKVKLALRNLSK